MEQDGKRIKFITATASGNLSLAAGLGHFTYTGDTIASADAQDTTVMAVTNDEGVAGHLASGRSRHGQGQIRYDTGSHYVGGWVRGKRSGTGKMEFACGDCYEGGWFRGMYNGYGKYISSTSDEYEGEWRADKMEGRGKITHYETGDVWEGTFVDGKKEGVGTLTSASGKVEQCEYRGGELVVASKVDAPPTVKAVGEPPSAAAPISVPTTAPPPAVAKPAAAPEPAAEQPIAPPAPAVMPAAAVVPATAPAAVLAAPAAEPVALSLSLTAAAPAADPAAAPVAEQVAITISLTATAPAASPVAAPVVEAMAAPSTAPTMAPVAAAQAPAAEPAAALVATPAAATGAWGWRRDVTPAAPPAAAIVASPAAEAVPLAEAVPSAEAAPAESSSPAPPPTAAPAVSPDLGDQAAVEEKAARDKATVERLQEELERRRGEVDKINALEEKIALEMSQLNLKQNDMQWEIDHGYKPRPDAERDADLKSIEATHLAFQERETSNAVTTLLASAKSPSDAAELAAEIGHVVREIESLIRERKEVLAPMIKDLRRRRQEIQETENLLWTRKAASEASAEQARKLEAAVAASVAAAPPAPASVAASELEPALMARMHEENAELKGRVAVLEHEASDLRSQFSTLEAQVAQLQELVGQRGAVNQAAAEEGSSVAAFAAFPAFPPDGGGLTWPADGDMITHAQAILPHVQAIIAAASPPPSPPLLKAPSPPTKLKKSTAATSGEKPAAPAGKLKLPAPAGMLKMPAPGSGSTSAASNRGGKASERGGQDSNRGQGSTRLTPRKQKKKPAAQRKPSTEITGKPSAIEAVPLDKPTGGEAEVGALKKVAPTITEEEAPHVAEVDEATVRKTKELAAKEVEMLEYMCKELRMRAIVRVSPSERQAAREEYKQRRAQLAAAQARVVSVHSNDDFKAYAASLRSLTASYKRTRAEVYESISGETSGHGSLQERPEDTAAYQKLKTSTLEAIHGGSLSAALDAIRRLSTIPMLTSELVAELLAAASKAPNLREEVLLRTSELEISEVAGHKIELVKLAARWRAAEAKDDPARRTIDEFEAKLTASAFHGV